MQVSSDFEMKIPKMTKRYIQNISGFPCGAKNAKRVLRGVCG